ncbi:16S rRNA (guanine(966)-N(2))-methyltransferase RsmD [Carnobacteriaceae bacterium 52-44]
MRVISGTYGGRRLENLPGRNTRPTGDKLKETMFNIIGPYFSGGKVLDLYAGSGALGIEAVSRGMDEAVLVDNNHTAINVIKENIKMTKEEYKFEVLSTSSDAALNLLANRHEKFRLIFLDPPYANQSVEQDIEQMIKQDLLDDIALMVCEVASDVTLPTDIQGIPLWDERKFGKTKLYIYQKIN